MGFTKSDTKNGFPLVVAGGERARASRPQTSELALPPGTRISRRSVHALGIADPARVLRKLLLIASFVSFSTVLALAQSPGDSSDPGTGVLTERSFTSGILEREFRYILYLPAGYDEEETYPTLYLLHGRGDTMRGWSQIAPTLDRLIAEELIPPVIAVFPDAPSSDRAGYYVDSLYTGDGPAAEAVESSIINELVPHIDDTYATIRHRLGRTVGGYSMGGYGAVRYVLAHADVFGSAIVLSPAVYTPLPPEDSSTREFGAFGVGENLFSPERYEELNYLEVIESSSLGRNPVRAFVAVGDDEWKHPDAMVHDLDVQAHFLYSRLARANGVTAELRVYDGGHDWDVWRRGFTEAIQWLSVVYRIARVRA